MDDETRPDGTAISPAGGQPLRKGRRHQPQGKLEIPVGLEKVLFLAARDADLRERLLEDRARTIAALGMPLRPSEKAILEAAPRAVLEAMIARIVPANPRKRRFMNLVAAAATSLAAGTAGIACDTIDNDDPINGVDAGTGADSDSDIDTDTDSVPDAGQDPDAGAWNAS